MAFNIIYELSRSLEIFEVVLSNLTQSEVLHAQRVCRYWSDIIAKSPALQQKLFLQPLSAAEASRRKPEFNPLVKALFPFLFQPGPFAVSFVHKVDIEESTAHWANDRQRRDAVLRPEASWRRMLPVQPAARIDGVLNNEWCCVGSIQLEWCEVDASKYVQAPGRVVSSANACNDLDLRTCATMGLLYDIVFHRLDDFAETGIIVQWHMFPESIIPRQPGWSKHYKDEDCTEWDFDAAFSDPKRHGDHKEIPTRPEDMKLRNEITVHSLYYSEYHQEPPNPTGLKILDVPKGLVQGSDKARHYEEGMFTHEYGLWGRLPPGLKSDEELAGEIDDGDDEDDEDDEDDGDDGAP